ncbi:MAG: hypothetical protein AB1440_26465 [Pseudomonadota bacterium]|jgi:hypothetical protein
MLINMHQFILESSAPYFVALGASGKDGMHDLQNLLAARARAGPISYIDRCGGVYRTVLKPWCIIKAALA